MFSASPESTQPHGSSSVNSDNAEVPINRNTVIAVSFLWVLMIGFAYWHFSAFEGRPNVQAAHPTKFPRDTALVASATGDTLLMFIHPKCPCTSASLNELAVLSTRCGGELNATAVFVKPHNAPDGWERTDYWERAQRIPGVRVVLDESAKEARTFGALTSGETFVYNHDRELVFSGGITGGRGHEGDNQGLDRVIGIIRNTTNRCASTNTYGCALNGPSEEAAIAQGLNK